MSLKSWLAERLPLAFLRVFVREQLTQPQPRHVSWLHTLGFAALLLLLLQVATGVLLLFYYKPGALTAYGSIKFISEKVTLGAFFRQLHVWGANFIVAFIILHVLRVFFSGGYKKPREITWMVGFGLFITVMGFALTGYLLPWDERAFWGTVVATDATKEFPLLGGYLLQLMRGGEAVSDITLTRFFALHVSVLPMALLVLVALHLFLVRYHHIAPLTRTDTPETPPGELLASGGRPYFPDHFKKELLVAYTAVAAVVILALVTQPHVGRPANPLVTPPGIKPEWYFLPVYQALKYLPGWLGVLGNGALLLFLLVMPLFDRNPERHPRRRKLATWTGVVLVVATVLLGVLGHLSDTTREIFGKRIHFDLKGVPSLVPPAESSQ